MLSAATSERFPPDFCGTFKLVLFKRLPLVYFIKSDLLRCKKIKIIICFHRTSCSQVKDRSAGNFVTYASGLGAVSRKLRKLFGPVKISNLAIKELFGGFPSYKNFQAYTQTSCRSYSYWPWFACCLLHPWKSLPNG